MDKNNRLFIHRNMKPVTVLNSVEIILTPQFYTFLRENLEIRFAYQAKQIAQSLFDDYLDGSKSYQYHVYKCQNDWCFFAYNIEEIDSFLESIGIERHRVSKIYFAQQLEEQLIEPIKLSDTQVLQTIDGTVTLIPSKLMKANTTYNRAFSIEEQKLTSGISMGASLDSFISLKETIILSSLFLILGTVFIIEGSRIKSSISTNEETLSKLFEQYPKYTSLRLRENILSKYKPIDKNERIKRQYVQDISKLLSGESQLEDLELTPKIVKATIKTANSNIANQVKRNAKAKKFKTSDNALTVKVEKKL